MILPIVAYGNSVLREKAKEVELDLVYIKKLVEDMFDTLSCAQGVGLAAPQIGKSERVFIVDSSLFAQEGDKDYDLLKNFKEIFINPVITKEYGDEWAFDEGCLSIPDIVEKVYRKDSLEIEYYNLNLEKQKKVYTGLLARIIQHEYDHIEGILFIDKLSPLKRRLLKGSLNRIMNGKISPPYKMTFHKK
ncbi:peptide deformylase [Ichthyobacterium seriolicida]|uniref:Peptide deformylase n=1 Tax=Ichthyobacterium seriolicida TaxID=242600 RepID=A0A1J1EAA1_9FLAO|nr:peptide deformylase [Ichthyobacterium seriolicida]BAV94859.1 peptide deformylase [Ichthyobacterium seriolicida]